MLLNSTKPLLEPCVFEFAKSFNQHFKHLGVILSPGADEPFYQAPNKDKQSVIFSNQDFFSSALHEIAHWCIAGPERQKLDDYGYWYEPDGRNHEQQAAFYQVEIRPQAIEWAFHLAANCAFKFSLDNLNNQPCFELETNFKRNVYAQLQDYFLNGFPASAQAVIQLLCCDYRDRQPIQLPKLEV